RDAIDTLVTYKRDKFLFIDTAGIRRRGKIERGVERFSLSRTQEAIHRCDLAVVLIDASEGLVEQDTKIIGTVLRAKKACLILVNKWDLHQDGSPETERLTSELERRLAFIPFASTLFISALKKTGLRAVFREITPIIEGFSRRIPTGPLNRAFEKAVSSHPPPQAGSKKPVRLNFITQTGTKPPAFVIFSNRPEALKQPYIRYLENEFRSLFSFPGSPLVFHIRKKTGEPPVRARRPKNREKLDKKTHNRPNKRRKKNN
ncbi:MAG TPA: GTP-binding protein, partial [Nitrospiria bacterium]|nr:GTP-binding protein [Nitrospiria bacterium]